MCMCVYKCVYAYVCECMSRSVYEHECMYEHECVCVCARLRICMVCEYMDVHNWGVYPCMRFPMLVNLCSFAPCF